MFLLCLMFSLVVGIVYSGQARAADFVVTSNADDGGGSALTLREAVTQANANSAADTITFELPQGSRTITLTQGDLIANATQTTTIDGGEGEITIDANDTSRIFSVGSSANLTLRSLTLTNGNSGSNGGAISNDGTLTVTDSTIFENRAGSGGGISNDGTLTVTDSTISGNSATNNGGGILSNTSEYSPNTTPPEDRATITNSTISGNSSGTRGSGIFNSNGYMEINYSTIANNTSTNAAVEGMESFGDDLTGTRLTASIVAGNTSSGQPRDVGNSNGSRAFESGGYNVIGVVDTVRMNEFSAQGDTTGRTVSEAFGTANPALADNGGSTQTIALEPGSVAIDRAASGPGTDQRGFTRPFDDPGVTNGAGSNGTDSGSFERVAAIPQTGPNFVVTREDDRDQTCAVDDCSLREAVKAANANATADEITFDLPEGSRAITLTQEEQITASATQTTTIDGEDEITISGNDTSRIFAVSGGNLTLIGLTLTNGNASGGGAILNTGTLTVTDSTISNNSSSGSGGGIFNDADTLTVIDSTISGNSAQLGGGGIFSTTSSYSPNTTPPARRTTITNSTISGNSSGNRGSGVYNIDGYTEINYSTIANNTSTNAAVEGVESFGDSVTGTRLTGTLVAGNTSSGQPIDVGNVTGNRPFESGGYNVIGQGRTSDFSAQGDTTGRTVAEAFGTANPTLADNGGSTQTIALQPGSVAINRIPASVSGVPETDQRGVERPQNSASDSGSFEFDAETDILVISPETLPDATEGEAYSQQLSASGGSGTYTYEVTAGELPDGLTLTDEGLISGTPTDAAQSETFTVQAEDGSGFTGEREYTLIVVEVNDPPTFTLGQNQTVDEDAGPQSVTGFVTNIDDGDADQTQTVTFNVTNDNNALFTQTGQPTISQNGTLTYTPAPDANGSATVTVVAEDDGGTANGGDDTSEGQTFTITVNAVNDAPVARDDELTTNEDEPLSFPASRLVANDSAGPSNESAQTLTVTRVFDAVRGTVELSNDGTTITFTPEENYNGDGASFSYEITDGAGNTSVATANVSVTVNAVNDAPVAVDDSYQTEEDTSLSVLSPGVLANDTDNEAQDLTVALEEDVQNGQLTLEADGSFTYTPDGGFNGQDTFTYAASDGEDESEPATVTIEVGAVNDAPTISEIEDVTVRENTSTAQIRFTVTDTDDPPGTLTLTSQSSNTALVKRDGIRLSGAGEERTVRIVPEKDRTGSARITITVEDPEGLTDTQTFIVRVTSAPQPPPSTRCTITGTSGSDLLRGTSGRDVICGLGGNDRLIGRGGNDILRGGPGNDLLEGGSGDDELYGGAGNDRLVGGAGEDRLDGGGGTNRLQQ